MQFYIFVDMLITTATLFFLSDYIPGILTTSLQVSLSIWRYPLALLILFAIAVWYWINRKRALARKYFVSDEKFQLPDTISGELLLLSYNIAGLPQIISRAKPPRANSIRKIGKLVSRFDIVSIQEDFNYNHFLYEHNQHLFRTQTMGKVPFSDGLSTLSKYPILEMRRITWDNYAGTDRLTPKGFAYMRIQIAKEETIDVYNLHATSQVTRRAVNARRQNLRQLAEYINLYSKDRPILIMGDFNAHYAFEGDDVHSFKKLTGAIDPWVDLFAGGIIPQPSSDFLIPQKLELTDEIESIDKILYRNGEDIVFMPKRYKIENKLFVDDSGNHLSDHLAVSLLVEWRKRIKK